MERRNVTLVLSGGGARGIAHIGVIEEIEQRGFHINSIAGTSMGALVGGIYALGKLPEFKAWLYTLGRRKIIGLLDFTFSNQGLIKGNRILSELKEFVSDTNIESLGIKYTATAFDLANDREVVFSSGSLYEAIRASISIPTVFTPVVQGNSVLVDGGVVNNIPIKNAIRTDNDLLIAVNVNADLPGKNSKTLIKGHDEKYYPAGVNNEKLKKQVDEINYLSLIDHTIASAINQVTQLTLQKYAPEILIEVSRSSAKAFEFLKARNLIEVGQLAAQSHLDSLQIPKGSSAFKVNRLSDQYLRNGNLLSAR